MIGLPLHGSHARILIEQPVVGFVILARARWVADLKVLIVCRNQILHHASRFEETDAFTIVEGIRHGRDAMEVSPGFVKPVARSHSPAIGIDFDEPRLFLSVLGDVNLVNVVWEAGCCQ